MGRVAKVKPLKKSSEAQETPSTIDKPNEHPLHSAWTWYYNEALGSRGQGSKWGDSMKVVHTFDTIEGFWSLVNHIERAGNIRPGSDYYLFKSNIRPAWEDPMNANGGRWLFTVPKSSNRGLDFYWMELIILMVRGGFEELDHLVCGAVVNLRGKGDRLNLWVSSCKEEEKLMKIGQTLKDVIMQGNMNHFKLQFITHNSSVNGPVIEI